MTILLIEDDADDAVIIARFLAGFTTTPVAVQHARTLNDGLACVAGQPIDLILCDLQLPDSRGLETVRRVLAAAPRVPLIVLTGQTDDTTLTDAALQQGAQDYLDKDALQPLHLHRAMHYAIERKRLATLQQDFLGAMSHELRTPLTVILYSLENVRDGLLGPVTPAQADALDRGTRHVRHVTTMVDDLLQLVRLQAGTRALRPQSLHVAAWLDTVLSDLHAIRPPHLQIATTVDDALPPCNADPDLLRTLVTNLLTNAVRYARQRIDIVATAPPQATAMTLRITNDGPAVPASQLGAIFEQFVQLDRDQRTTDYRGTGLGLAICREIVTRHHGTIRAENGTDGVSFIVELPLMPGEE